MIWFPKKEKKYQKIRYLHEGEWHQSVLENGELIPVWSSNTDEFLGYVTLDDVDEYEILDEVYS